MVKGMDGRELCLPSEFLVDDFYKEKEGEEKKQEGEAAFGGGPIFPCEFPYDFSSETSSPVESVTETESEEEEDYLDGLTRQMAHSFLQDDEGDSSVLPGRKSQNPKAMSTSPQSTLCGYGNWSDMGRTSPSGPSQVSSPPSTPLEQRKDDAWLMLYAAADQVSRMRFNDHDNFNGRGLLGPPKRTSITTHPQKPSTGYYASPALAQQQILFEHLKQQQLMKQQLSGAWGRQSRASGGGAGYREGRCSRSLCLPSSAWPPLQSQQQQQQPQTGYGMRAVFLSSPSTRRTSTGTGVFLPQTTGNHTETRKKPACPPVLLPARVVQALNLNLDEMSTHPRFPGAFVLGHDALLARSNAVQSKQRRNHLHSPSAAAAAEEIRLPAEWTY